MMSFGFAIVHTSLGIILFMHWVINRTPRHLQEIDEQKQGHSLQPVAMEGGNVTTWIGDWSLWPIGRDEPPSPGQARHCRQAAFQISPACNHLCESPPTTSVCLDSRPPHDFRGPSSDVISNSKRSFLKKACSPGRLSAVLQFQSRLRIRSPLTRIYPASWLRPGFLSDCCCC